MTYPYYISCMVLAAAAENGCLSKYRDGRIFVELSEVTLIIFPDEIASISRYVKQHDGYYVDKFNTFLTAVKNL